MKAFGGTGVVPAKEPPMLKSANRLWTLGPKTVQSESTPENSRNFYEIQVKRTEIPVPSFWFWPSSSFPVILCLRFGLRSDSNPLAFKGFSNSYLVPTMESPGSDLVVEEQLTDIPSVFKQSDMSYLKERFDMPSQIKLSAPGPLERADSPRDGWIYLYEIAFKIGLRLPFHRIINMVLNFYTSYLNLSGRLRITAEQKNVIRALLRNKTRSLLSILSEDSFRSARYWPALEEATSEQQAEQNFEEEDPSTQQSEEIPEGIPLPILEVPYLHILEDCIRLLYGMPTDPLWASYPAADMGKLKMKISKAELEATKKKKKDKQAAAKGGASSTTDKGQERPALNVIVEPSSLPIAIPSGDSPLSKRPRCSAPRPQLKIRAKKNRPRQCWG
ncbi:hypothetical protein FNV43_RR00431 [Rhamnella rubrinervis]|uniref:Uncharacterized protein n=1 Tax=Rhamnella rubrinervis TaxID=2594499 RepID=A0A8K0HQL9_9ROSA|nr:hypothetical protein FNV43_RR00431 [Rhamnella rubrinervis]